MCGANTASAKALRKEGPGVFREHPSVWLEQKERETCRELSLRTGKVSSLRAQREGAKVVRTASIL